MFITISKQLGSAGRTSLFLRLQEAVLLDQVLLERARHMVHGCVARRHITVYVMYLRRQLNFLKLNFNTSMAT